MLEIIIYNFESRVVFIQYYQFSNFDQTIFLTFRFLTKLLDFGQNFRLSVGKLSFRLNVVF